MLTRLAAIMLGLIGAPAAAQDLQLPESRPGSLAADYIRIHNDADAAAFARFVEERCSDELKQMLPAQQLEPMFAAIRAQTGDLRPHSVLQQTDDTIVVLVELDSEMGWGALTIAVDPEPPHKVTGFTITPAASPDTAPLDFSGAETLADMLEIARSAAGLPALAAAIAEGEHVTDKAAVGVRRADADVAARADDRFHIGSITKSVTATVMARLIDRGLLTWDTTIGDVLPGVEMLDAYRGVTLEQVLRHRAGIVPHLTFNEGEMSRLLALPGTPTEQRGAYAAEVLTAEPVVEPGTETVYSNAGYALAGHIAEVVSAQSWEQLVREEVFEPLGMTTAGFGWPADSDPDQPQGHAGGTVVAPGDYRLGPFVAPAGDVHCSAADLARYLGAHLGALRASGDYLRQATARRLHTPPPDDEYACGWVIARTDDGAPLHWHNGSAGTFYAYAAFEPDAATGVALLTNAAAPDAERILVELARAIATR